MFKKTNKATYKSIRCINKLDPTYIIGISPVEIAEETIKLSNDKTKTLNIKFISHKHYGEVTLDVAKAIVKSYIKKYDKSAEVNTFKLNGNSDWFDKNTRVGIINMVNLFDFNETWQGVTLSLLSAVFSTFTLS